MTHIFISYSKRDTRQLAIEIRRRLTELPGFTAWMDDSLHSGEDWAYQIQEEIDRCDFIVVLLSPDINRPKTSTEARSFVLREIHYAQQVHKPIIPVMAEKTVLPVQIAGIQFIDLTTNLEEGLKRLLVEVTHSVETLGQESNIPQSADIRKQPLPLFASVTQKRLLEAAMPACSTLGAETQLKVKISLPDSPGLKAELPEVLPSGDIIQQGDVLATRFTMRFPKDASGELSPGTVCIDVSTDDFNVSLARPAGKSVCEDGQFELRVPADDDSRTLNFKLSPKSASKTGLATVYVTVYQNGELVTDTSVPTHIVGSMSELPICGDWRLNTMKVGTLQQEQPPQPITQTGELAAADEYVEPSPEEAIGGGVERKREQAKPSSPVTTPATSNAQPPPIPQAQPFMQPGAPPYQRPVSARPRRANRALVSTLVAIGLLAIVAVLLPPVINQNIASVQPTTPVNSTLIPNVVATNTPLVTATLEPTFTSTVTPSATNTSTNTPTMTNTSQPITSLTSTIQLNSTLILSTTPENSNPISPNSNAPTSVAPTSSIGSTQTYPCPATVKNDQATVTLMKVVRSEPIYATSPIITVRIGQPVLVLEKTLEMPRTVWYLIEDDQHKLLGYISEDFLALSPICPS